MTIRNRIGANARGTPRVPLGAVGATGATGATGPAAPDPVEVVFDADVVVTLDADTWSVYSGAAAPVAFTAGAIAAANEQNVKSYLIPAGTATALSLAADLNVNELDVFSVADDYLLAFTQFSGAIVGTGRALA